MIFTSRFGALAARPNFRKENAELELEREIEELLETVDLEPADERGN